MTAIPQPEFSARRNWVAAGVVLCVGIAVAGFLYFRRAIQIQRAQVEHQLAIIAELKVQQINRWRSERLGDADYLRTTPYVARRATDVLKEPDIPVTQQMFDASLRPFIRDGSFDHLLLLDEQLNVRWVSPAGASTNLAEPTRQLAAQALRSQKVVVADLHREAEDEPVTLSLMVPLVVRREGHKDNVPAAGRESSPLDRSTGLLVMQINAETTLFPLVQTWPAPSQTAETMLVRREGDEVVFLNALRHLREAALKTRLPLTNPASPAVRGVTGNAGEFAGRDYRNQPVISAVRPVPDTSWVLVAKMDEAEVLADTEVAVRTLFLAMGSLILMIITGTAYGSRRHQAAFFRGLYEAERQQREAQALYRTTLYSLGDAVITTDPDGRVREMNPVAEKLTGWSEKAARGQPLTDVFRIVNAETREVVASPAQQALAEARVVGLTNQTLLLARDGREYPIADSAAPIRDDKGVVYGAVLVFSDQTERYAARKALQESEAFIRVVMEHLPIGVAVNSMDPKLAFSYMNDNFARLYRTTREALATPDAFWGAVYEDPDFREVIRRRVTADCASGDPKRMHWEEVPIVRAGQETRFISASNAPIPGKNLMISTVWDVTKRRQAEHQLRESEDRYRLLVEESPDAIGIFQDDTLVFANSTCVRMLGARTKEELLGRQSTALIHPEDLPGTQERIRRRLAGEKNVYPAELRYLRLDGTAFPVEVSATPIEFEGKPAIQFFARDITARRQADALLRESEALYHSLVEHLPQQVFRKDRAGRFTFANGPFCQTLGKTLPEILGRTDQDFFPPELAAKYLADDQRVIQTGQVFEGEEEYRSADGKTFLVNVVKTPLRDANGGIIGVQGISWDITERRQNEQRLRLQGSVLQAAANAIVITDPNGLIEWANPAFTAFTGYDLTEAIGRTPGELLKSGRHDAAFYAAMWETIQAGKVWRGEMINRRKDGSFYDEEMVITPLIEKGRITHFIAIKQDVTARKRIEIRQAAFAALGQRLGAAKTVREAAGIVVEVADQLLGLDACSFDLYSAAENRLTHVLNLDTFEGRRGECPATVPDGRPTAFAQRVLTQGAVLIVKDHRRRMLAEAAPFGDRNRPSGCILATPIRKGRDVIGLISIHSYAAKAYDQHGLETLQALADHCGGALDRLQAEDARKESEERYRALFEQAQDVLFTVASDQTINSLNPAFKTITGFAPADWVGRPFPQLLHPEDLPRVLEVFQQVLRNEQPPGFEARVLIQSGGYVTAEFAVAAIHRHGGIAGVMGMARDVTERRQLEYQLRQSQKMEAIGQLAGGVAHDFNNMLAVIRGNAELLLLDGDQLTAPAVEGLKQITAAADRAGNLTRQLLAFSRKQVMLLQPANLNEVVGNLTKMLNRIIGEDIELQCSYAGRLPFVRADVGMLEQVLVNLAVNARDAMPHGGQLMISTRHIQFDAADVLERAEASAGEFVCLAVRDTGTGIPPEHLRQIFEPFFTTKQPGKGTGLGLATVYGIVKQHGGWAEVASTLGQGSTFSIYLPAVPPPAEATTAPVEPPLRGGREAIFLVEDEREVRAMTRRALESFGYRVVEAVSGREALEVWKTHGAEIDLLLTDLVMPGGLNGRELAERLCAEKPGLKVIYTSGYSSTVAGKDTDFFRRNGSYYLQKPCPTRALISTVRDCLDAH